MGGGVAARVKYIKIVDMHVCPPRGGRRVHAWISRKEHGQASASSDCDPWDGKRKTQTNGRLTSRPGLSEFGGVGVKGRD